MKAVHKASAVLTMLALAGCASAPKAPAIAAADSAPPMMMSASGLVIGTLSYHYVEVADPTWVVHLTRVDGGGGDYALPVSVDNARHRGTFAGALPQGVYAFREAAASGQHYAVSAVQMPFEVNSGEVRDAGHYALNPVLSD